MGRTIPIWFLIILLFMIGLWSMYSPLPDEMARIALGEESQIQSQGRAIVYSLRGNGTPVVLAASAGREASDFNELTDALVAARMLVVQADSDKIAPREDTSDLLAQEFGERVEVAVIKDAGHAFLPESPDEVARVSIAFLKDLKRAS